MSKPNWNDAPEWARWVAIFAAAAIAYFGTIAYLDYFGG